MKIDLQKEDEKWCIPRRGKMTENARKRAPRSRRSFGRKDLILEFEDTVVISADRFGKRIELVSRRR